MKKRANKAEFSSVSLPKPLLEKVKELTEGTGFTSTSSFVEYVLREILAENKNEERLEECRETVKKRLKALGYIK